jgi:hypothetical protein
MGICQDTGMASVIAFLVVQRSSDWSDCDLMRSDLLIIEALSIEGTMSLARVVLDNREWFL